MKCPECQTENHDNQKFCGECGARLEKICPGCHAENPPQYKFCGECGRNLPLSSEPTHRDLSFEEKIDKIQRYLPKGLTEKILSQRDRIEGERKQVTVMFCDMEGFTALVEKLGPEDAYGVMDQVYEILIHKIHDYEGTVNEMTGDGVMALFGAPIALEDAPQRAIRSSLAIHREMVRFSDKIKQEREYLRPFKMRVGIHTGPVVVGTLGNDLRVEFKAVGDTVNLASRVEGLADPGTTYVTDNTFKLTEGFFRFESLGEKKVKGKQAAVKVYRVIAPSTRRTRFDVSAERGLTPFVGRERELELLLDGFDRCKDGRGQAFSIISEAGVGKSRLLYEFRKAVANENVTFLEGRCLSYSRGIAYHPVVDILKSNFDILDTDGDLSVREKVARGLRALGAEEHFTLPYILELLSVKDSGIDKISTSPEATKERIIAALKHIVLKGSELRPLIMAIEDLHWIDKASEESLKDLANSIMGSRVLLIFTYRPEFVHTWGSKSYHTQMNLGRLSNRESLAMVTHLIGSQNIARELEDLILEKTEGVPFFVEEFIKSLEELSILDRRDGKVHLVRGPDRVSIPSTIQDVIMARVDSLPEEAKEILRTGSAIEREFSYQLIKQLISIPEQELLSNLSILKDLELIYERGVYPQSSFIFKHALTREVVYDSIIAKNKSRLHEKIGNGIEKIHRQNLDEYYGVLAEHYLRSQNYGKCFDYSVKAGDKAAAVFAWHEARGHYETAFRTKKEEEVARKAEVLRKLAIVTLYDLDVDASLDYAQSALRLFEQIGDKRNQLGILMHIQSIYSGGYLDGSREDKALEYLERAVKIVKEEPDSQEKGLIYQRTAHLYLHRGQPATTLYWAQKAEDLFARLNIPMGTSLGTALTYTGRIEDGFAYNEKNWAPVQKMGNPLIIALIGHELTLTRALLRDIPGGREWGERVLPEVKRAGDRFEGFLWRPLALVYALAGEVSKAEEACEAERRIEGKTLMSCFFEDAACIGFHYLRQGEWERAREYLEWAIEIHEDRNNVGAIIGCSFTLGCLNLEEKNYSKSEELLLRSLGICRNGGNVIFELWVLPVICELYLKIDQPEKAQEAIVRGQELLKSDQNWYGLAAPLYTAKGMLAGERGHWEEAADSFDQAIFLNKKHNLPWDEAKTLYEWGKMLSARGVKEHLKSARGKFDQALEIFQNIGAKKDAEKVLAEKKITE